MSTQQFYLKPNTVLEPLVDKWYAWSHLISPATAAMNIVGRHHSITESYLAAPSIHAEAVLNPKMRGGPFMDFGGGRIDEVTALHEASLQQQAKI
ncbi:MAG: MBL fold metallo-hydrolase, partial [Ferruginibacter sp.]